MPAVATSADQMVQINIAYKILIGFLSWTQIVDKMEALRISVSVKKRLTWILACATFAWILRLSVDGSLIVASDFFTECPCIKAYGSPLEQVTAIDVNSCWSLCNAYQGCAAFSYCVSASLVVKNLLRVFEENPFRVGRKSVRSTVRMPWGTRGTLS